MRKNKNRRPWIFALIVVIVIAGVVVMRNRRNHDQQPTIKTGKVDRGSITTTVSATGTLQPLTTVEVKSNVGGSVVYLGVDEGDRVSAGQVIARIDPSDSQTNLEQSQADLVGSRARVAQARENLAMQRRQTAKLRLAQAEKAAELQTTTSSTAIEQAQQALESARVRLAQSVEQAEIQPRLSESSIAQAKSSLAAAKASYQQTKSATVPQLLAGVQASLDQAKANYDFAGKNLERQQQLLAKGFVARSQVDAAEQSYLVAKAQLETAKKKFDTANDDAQQTQEAAQARVDQADAALKNAEINRSQDTLKEHDVAAARASVKQAEAGLKTAQANQIQNSLKEDDVAAARAALKQSQSSLDNARANAFQIGMKEKDITQAMAQVTRSEASVTNALTQLGYTTITAPRDGIVIKKYIDPGSIVTAGRSSLGGTGAGISLVDLADISRMFVLVNVDETDIAQIALQQEVDITIDAYPNELFTGYVTKISPQTVADQNVTTVPVTVEIEAPDLRLKPGMNATCDFITAKRRDVLRVPNSAVIEGDRDITVTVMQNGKQEARPVEVGLADNDYTEILSGLKEGDEIVTQIVQPQSATSQNDRRRRMGGPF